MTAGHSFVVNMKRIKVKMSPSSEKFSRTTAFDPRESLSCKRGLKKLLRGRHDNTIWRSAWKNNNRSMIKLVMDNNSSVRFLVNKINRRTEFQLYWYYEATCFRQPLCSSSGVLSRPSALVNFMQLWWPFATRSRMELIAVPSYSW